MTPIVMATHSCTLAWKIPWMQEPRRLQSTGSQRIGHDWATTHTHTNGKESTCNVGDLGQEDALEKEMATQSSSLAWRIPWPEEPCGLQSMGLQRVRHIWATIIHVCTYKDISMYTHANTHKYTNTYTCGYMEIQKHIWAFVRSS